jgi:hypothetical protein
MLLEKTDEQTDLITLFVTIDTFFKTLTPKAKKKYLPLRHKRGRKPLLSTSELITLALFRYYVGISDVKHYHKFLLSHYATWFPKRIPNYQNFNAQLNQITPIVIVLLQWIMYATRRKQDSLHFLDASSVKVCHNKRIPSHKVCKGLAKRGKTTMGWFFGFKMHAVCNSIGQLVSLIVTPGNTDDRKFVLKLLKGIKGLVIADAGYVSKKLMQELFENGILFVTDVKKSMKRLMSEAEHALLKLRQRVEIMFSVIKYRYKAEASVARSPLGFFSRFFLAVLAFAVKQLITDC